MTWKRNFLAKFSIQTALVGLVSGIWGAAFHDFGLSLGAAPAWPSSPGILAGAGLGMAICMGFAATESLLNRYWRRLVRVAVVALPVGGIIGGAGFFLTGLGGEPGTALFPALAAPLVSLPVLLGVMAGVGAACSLVWVGKPGSGFRRGMKGFVAGLVVGFPMAFAFGELGTSAPVFLAGFACWGAVVTWAVYWWEKKMARSWLRLLTGRGDDNFFPLNGHKVTLGAMESNNVPLMNFQEVFPLHCHLTRNGGRYEIIDNEEGGTVLVNYRQVKEQALKDGDLVKIGTALLQYGETS